MKSRMIRPGFWTDEKTVTLSYPARLLFIGLWCVADDEGRLEWRPGQVKMLLFPSDQIDLLPLAEELKAAGLVEVYGAIGKEFMQVCNFLKHQKFDARRPSQFPAQCGANLREVARSGADRRETAQTGANLTKPNLSEPQPNRTEPNQAGSAEPQAAPAPDPDDPIVLEFTCAGPVRCYSLTASKLSEWVALYPALDVPQEIRKARQWLIDNPGRHKTHRGMPKFLGAWLGRAQDGHRGGGGGGYSPADSRARRADLSQEGFDPKAEGYGRENGK